MGRAILAGIVAASSALLAGCTSQTTTTTRYFIKVEADQCGSLEKGRAAFNKSIGGMEFSFDREARILCAFDHEGELAGAYRASACDTAGYALVTKSGTFVLGEELTFRPVSNCKAAGQTPDQLSETA